MSLTLKKGKSLVLTKYLSHLEEDEKRKMWQLRVGLPSALLEGNQVKVVILYSSLNRTEFLKIILVTEILVAEFCFFAFKCF